MSEAEDEFIHHTVCTDRSADQIEPRVVGVVENEVVQVEVAQSSPTDTTC